MTLLVEPTRDQTKDSQAAKGCSEEGKPRYPRRNIVRRNYTEMEVPDDDHYICELHSYVSSGWTCHMAHLVRRKRQWRVGCYYYYK